MNVSCALRFAMSSLLFACTSTVPTKAAPLPFSLKKLPDLLSLADTSENVLIDYLSVDSHGKLLLSGQNLGSGLAQAYILSRRGAQPQPLALPSELSAGRLSIFEGELFENGAVLLVAYSEGIGKAIYYPKGGAPQILQIPGDSLWLVSSQNGAHALIASGPEGGPLAYYVVSSKGTLSPLTLPAGNWLFSFSSKQNIAAFNDMSGSGPALIFDLARNQGTVISAPGGDFLSLLSKTTGWISEGDQLKRVRLVDDEIRVLRSRSLRHGLTQPRNAMSDSEGGFFFTTFGALPPISYLSATGSLGYPSCMFNVKKRPFHYESVIAARGAYALVQSVSEQSSLSFDLFKWKPGMSRTLDGVDYCADLSFEPQSTCGFTIPEGYEGSGYLFAPIGGTTCAAGVTLFADKRARKGVKAPLLKISTLVGNVTSDSEYELEWGKRLEIPIAVPANGWVRIEGPANSNSLMHSASLTLVTPPTPAT